MAKRPENTSPLIHITVDRTTGLDLSLLPETVRSAFSHYALNRTDTTPVPFLSDTPTPDTTALTAEEHNSLAIQGLIAFFYDTYFVPTFGREEESLSTWFAQLSGQNDIPANLLRNESWHTAIAFTLDLNALTPEAITGALHKESLHPTGRGIASAIKHEVYNGRDLLIAYAIKPGDYAATCIASDSLPEIHRNNPELLNHAKTAIKNGEQPITIVKGTAGLTESLSLQSVRPLVHIEDSVRQLTETHGTKRTIWQASYNSPEVLQNFSESITRIDPSLSPDSLTSHQIPHILKAKNETATNINSVFRQLHTIEMGFRHIPVISPETAIDGPPTSLSTLSEGLLFSPEEYPRITELLAAYKNGTHPSPELLQSAAREYISALEGHRSWVHEKNASIYSDNFTHALEDKNIDIRLLPEDALDFASSAMIRHNPASAFLDQQIAALTAHVQTNVLNPDSIPNAELMELLLNQSTLGDLKKLSELQQTIAAEVIQTRHPIPAGLSPSETIDHFITSITGDEEGKDASQKVEKAHDRRTKKLTNMGEFLQKFYDSELEALTQTIKTAKNSGTNDLDTVADSYLKDLTSRLNTALKAEAHYTLSKSSHDFLSHRVDEITALISDTLLATLASQENGRSLEEKTTAP